MDILLQEMGYRSRMIRNEFDDNFRRRDRRTEPINTPVYWLVMQDNDRIKWFSVYGEWQNHFLDWTELDGTKGQFHPPSDEQVLEVDLEEQIIHGRVLGNSLLRMKL